jgi:hypothetical protein
LKTCEKYNGTRLLCAPLLRTLDDLLLILFHSLRRVVAVHITSAGDLRLVTWGRDVPVEDDMLLPVLRPPETLLVFVLAVNVEEGVRLHRPIRVRTASVAAEAHEAPVLGLRPHVVGDSLALRAAVLVETCKGKGYAPEWFAFGMVLRAEDEAVQVLLAEEDDAREGQIIPLERLEQQLLDVPVTNHGVADQLNGDGGEPVVQYPAGSVADDELKRATVRNYISDHGSPVMRR